MKCMKCSHKQNYAELGDGDRCCRLKNIPIKHAWRMCNEKYYLDKKEGLSLYALSEWINTLSDEEKNKPLGVMRGNIEFEPIYLLKVAKNMDWSWSIYCKFKEK